MKNLKTFSIVGIFALLIFVMQGCGFGSANLSSLKTSKDKAGNEESSGFISGETLYGKAEVSNNSDKVKVKLYLVADDVKGMTKGETLKSSEFTVDVTGNGAAYYSVPVADGFLPGSYKLNADLINDAGEKKDNKTVTINITGKGR